MAFKTIALKGKNYCVVTINKTHCKGDPLKSAIFSVRLHHQLQNRLSAPRSCGVRLRRPGVPFNFRRQHVHRFFHSNIQTEVTVLVLYVV